MTKEHLHKTTVIVITFYHQFRLRARYHALGFLEKNRENCIDTDRQTAFILARSYKSYAACIIAFITLWSKNVSKKDRLLHWKTAYLVLRKAYTFIHQRSREDKR